MAKPVEGYLSNDEVFFATEAEADLHNAEMDIRSYCVSHTPIPLDADKVIALIEALADTIKEYIDAKERVDGQIDQELGGQGSVGGINRGTVEFWTTQTEHYFGEGSETQADQANEDEGRKDAGPVLQQQIDGHEPVSDLGSGAQSEGVSSERAVDGIGSGQRNARSVRRRADLATERPSGTD